MVMAYRLTLRLHRQHYIHVDYVLYICLQRKCSGSPGLQMEMLCMCDLAQPAACRSVARQSS